MANKEQTLALQQGSTSNGWLQRIPGVGYGRALVLHNKRFVFSGVREGGFEMRLLHGDNVLALILYVRPRLYLEY